MFVDHCKRYKFEAGTLHFWNQSLDSFDLQKTSPKAMFKDAVTLNVFWGYLSNSPSCNFQRDLMKLVVNRLVGGFWLNNVRSDRRKVKDDTTMWHMWGRGRRGLNGLRWWRWVKTQGSFNRLITTRFSLCSLLQRESWDVHWGTVGFMSVVTYGSVRHGMGSVCLVRSLVVSLAGARVSTCFEWDWQRLQWDGSDLPCLCQALALRK